MKIFWEVADIWVGLRVICIGEGFNSKWMVGFKFVPPEKSTAYTLISMGDDLEKVVGSKQEVCDIFNRSGLYTLDLK